jgi:hypothetical protein
LSPDQKRWSIQPSNSGGIYAKKGISTQSYNSSHHCLIKDSPKYILHTPEKWIPVFGRMEQQENAIIP